MCLKWNTGWFVSTITFHISLLKLYFIIKIFLFLAIGMHFKYWFGHPVEYIIALPHAGAYGLGILHLLVFTLAGYLVLVLLMALGHMIKKVFSR